MAQQIQTAQVLPPEVGAELTGQLVCYARSVINGEWDRIEDGSLGEDINPWGAVMFETLQGVELSTPQQEAAYGKWLDQTSVREEARQDRIHGAEGLMPTPLWIALFFIAAIVFLYIFGFADSSERAWVQALFMGSVVAVIVTMLLLLRFMDDPFSGGVGGLQPVAMERAVQLIDQQLAVIGGNVPIPCDAVGVASDGGQRGECCGRRGRTAGRRDWVEIVATVLLALAAVATAWSSYQATRWNGEQTKAWSRATPCGSRRHGPRVSPRARPRSTSPCSSSWSTPAPPATPSSRSSTATGCDPSSGPRSTPGWRPPADRPGRAADPVRDGGVPLQPRAEAERLDAEAEVMAAAVGATCSGPPTTSSPSSCSLSPCSSPA